MGLKDIFKKKDKKEKEKEKGGKDDGEIVFGKHKVDKKAFKGEGRTLGGAERQGSADEEREKRAAAALARLGGGAGGGARRGDDKTVRPVSSGGGRPGPSVEDQERERRAKMAERRAEQGGASAPRPQGGYTSTPQKATPQATASPTPTPPSKAAERPSGTPAPAAAARERPEMSEAAKAALQRMEAQPANVSEETAQDMKERKQKNDLIGRIQAVAAAKNVTVPFGVPAMTVEALQRYLAQLQGQA